MNKNFDQIALPPDLYSRNALMAEGITQYKQQKSLDQIKVLDVGGRNGRLASFLDETDELTILDIREGDESNLIVGDGRDMHMFADGTFDVVVSGDVYEHVPPEQREDFVREALRVSKDLVILAAPFDHPGVHEAEKMLNDFYRSMQGKDHQWLREHIQHGLPDVQQLEALLGQMGVRFHREQSNDLDNWVLLQLLVFYSFRYGVPEAEIGQFYRFYNRNLWQVEDFRLGAYRSVYFITAEAFQLKVPYAFQDDRRRTLRKKAFEVMESFTHQKEYQLKQQHQLHEAHEHRSSRLEQLLGEAELQRSRLKQSLRDKDTELHQVDRALQQAREQSERLEVEIDKKETHIINIEHQLSEKTGHIQILQGERDQLHHQLELKDQHVRNLDDLINAHEKRMHRVKDRLQEKNSFIKELYAELKQTRQQRESLRKSSLRKQARISQLKHSIKHFQSTAEVQQMRWQQALAAKDVQLAQRDDHIATMNPDYVEFQAVKKSLSYRFLKCHRSITNFFVQGFKKLGQGLELLRQQGIRRFFQQIKWRWQRQQSDPSALPLNQQYQLYLQQHPMTNHMLEEMEKDVESFSHQPTISIITPVYNVDPKWLDKCIQSVLSQLYPHWELCLYDDASTNSKTLACLQKWETRDSRIKVCYGMENQHISAASNHALEMATGEFVGLLDNDDELTVDALYEIVKMINLYPNIDMLYSDEDKLDMQGHRVEPHFKPDWSPETFESMMYLCHFSVFRRSLIEQIGGFRMGFEGSQDYDLVLRVTEATNRILHVPKVLYHWRKIPGSAAATADAKSYAYEAAQKALLDRLHREHDQGRVQRCLSVGTYRINRDLDQQALVSIIIPFKDQSEFLQSCVASVLGSSYRHFELLLVSNNSEDQETFQVAKGFVEQDERVKFLEYNHPFNFSAINNWAVQQAKGDYCLFLNNDTEVISESWIEALLEHASRDSIGAVGAKLLYPNNTIQHAGVVLGLGGVAGHAFRGFPRHHPGYMCYAGVVRNCSAVTAACMMVSKRKFEEVGGFNEGDLAVAFNDVDFCLKLQEKGYRNIYTPYAELYHYESLSRGFDDTPEKQQRFAEEVQYMKNRWGNLLENDPYYNPHLTRSREDFSLRI